MIRVTCLIFTCLVSTLPVSADTIEFDFGSPLHRAVGINNISSPHLSDISSISAQSREGKRTTVKLRQVDVWHAFNTKGYNSEGYGPLHDDAMRDSFFIDRRELAQTSIALEGLKPGYQYELRFFASRMGGYPHRDTVYRAGGKEALLKVSNNINQFASLAGVKADEQGMISITIMPAVGQRYAHLGWLEVKGEFFEIGEQKKEQALSGPPRGSAASWAILDRGTGRVVASKRGHVRRQPASTNKIMTALLILEMAAKDKSILGEKVLVNKEATELEGSNAALAEGSELPVIEMLHALLIPSGTDAAHALAEHFGERLAGKKEKETSWQRFVAAMNQKASELKLHHTRYVDPHGLSFYNATSAHDLAKLCHLALQNKLFATIVKTPVHTFKPYRWYNTNGLLKYGGYYGIKTGTTIAAQKCLLVAYKKDDFDVIVTLLGASSTRSRYAEVQNLVQWAWQNRDTFKVKKRGVRN